MVKNLPEMQEAWVDPLEKGMATHSSILAWRIPWTEEPGRLQSAAAAKSLQSCLTLCNPRDGIHQAPPSLGFSRQEHWSGLPFLLQCMKVKVSVAESSPTLCEPIDCSLPGSSVHGILQARMLEWVAIPFSRGFS